MSSKEESKQKISISAKKLVAGWPKVGYDKSDPRVFDFYRKMSGTVTDKKSLFRGKRLADVFIFAMALGKHAGIKKPYEKKNDRNDNIDIEYFATTPEYVWMLIAVAIEESNGDLNIFAEPKTKILDVCEQYANYGIGLLMDMEASATTSDPYYGYEEKFSELLKSKDDGMPNM